MELIPHIKLYLAKSGVSQHEFARRVQISKHRINKFMHYKFKPTELEIIKINQYLEDHRAVTESIFQKNK